MPASTWSGIYKSERKVHRDMRIQSKKLRSTVGCPFLHNLYIRPRPLAFPGCGRGNEPRFMHHLLFARVRPFNWPSINFPSIGGTYMRTGFMFVRRSYQASDFQPQRHARLSSPSSGTCTGLLSVVAAFQLFTTLLSLWPPPPLRSTVV